MLAASVTTTFGIQVASHSDIRYHASAKAFHIVRFRSNPSTFNATGIPNTRGTQVNTALAALQYNTASFLVSARCKVERKVCTTVSKYLCRIVGRYFRPTPRKEDSECRFRQ